MDNLAHLLELQADAHKAIDIENYIKAHAPIYSNSNEYTDIIKRIDEVPQFRQELFLVLNRNLYGLGS